MPWASYQRYPIWSPSEYLETAEEQQAFAAVAPSIQQAVIEDSGALPHEERPEDVVDEIQRFWASLSGP